jgi:hypothetical protein
MSVIGLSNIPQRPQHVQLHIISHQKNHTFVVPTNSVRSPATRILRAEINFNDKLKISDEQVRALAKRKFN